MILLCKSELIASSSLTNQDSFEPLKNSSENQISEDEDLLFILENLPQDNDLLNLEKTLVTHTSGGCLSGCFSSNTVFNLSKKELSAVEIEVLEKGLDYAPIQRKINHPEIKKDMEDFCRRMRIKWHFRNEPTLPSNQNQSFKPKSLWKPPKSHSGV